MIVAGKNEVFSIAAELTGTTGGWVFGRLRFFLHGHCCGDWKDEVDLKGCYSWLIDFATNPRNRFEQELLALPANEVFLRLVDPVLASPSGIRRNEVYPNTFSRFHISHLGMSAFDRVVMVLIEDNASQRCVWREGDKSELHDDMFPRWHMQSVAAEFCGLLCTEASAIGADITAKRK
jgi:hypothetical protein